VSIGHSISVILNRDPKLLALDHDGLLSESPAVVHAWTHGTVHGQMLVSRGREKAPYCCVDEIMGRYIKPIFQEIAKRRHAYL
jgi:hypothetical protein